MAKRVFIIHGWEGAPGNDWYPWLKKELEERGFEVHVPAMPNPDAPEIKAWIAKLKKEIGKPDENTYLVGHSIACLTILHYLAKLLKTAKLGGAVFVAGWFTLTEEGAPDADSKAIAKPWIETPVDTGKARQKVKRMIAIFSDDDPYVPFEENKKAYEKFCDKIIIEKGKGHINAETGVMQLPSILKAILELAKL